MTATLTINPRLLAALLKGASLWASKDTTLPGVSGVFLRLDPGGPGTVSALGTDRYRVMRGTLTLATHERLTADTAAPTDVWLPPPTVDVLMSELRAVRYPRGTAEEHQTVDVLVKAAPVQHVPAAWQPFHAFAPLTHEILSPMGPGWPCAIRGIGGNQIPDVHRVQDGFADTERWRLARDGALPLAIDARRLRDLDRVPSGAARHEPLVWRLEHLRAVGSGAGALRVTAAPDPRYSIGWEGIVMGDTEQSGGAL